MKEFITVLKTFSVDIIKILLLALLIFFLLAVLVSIIKEGFYSEIFLETLNTYVQIILTSWPATIAIVSCFVLINHRESIDHFIKNRMTEVGPSGVKGGITYDAATASESRTKTIKEEKEVEQAEKEYLKKTGPITLEAGVERRPAPDQNKEDAYRRYKKVSQIEEVVQTNLSLTYEDRYKPEVKISDGERSTIVDGLLRSKKGKTYTAIEIKYISPKSYPVLKYMLTKKIRQLGKFNIWRVHFIIVTDQITVEEAEAIQQENAHLGKIFFYTWDGENVHEVRIPSRTTHLF